MAEAQRRFDKLADRYNEIELRNPASVPFLEALAADAYDAFRSGKDLHSGFLWATCRSELGFLQEALDFFESHLAFVSKDLQNINSIYIYAHYARILGFLGEFDKAAAALDFIFPILPFLGDLKTGHMALTAYGEARQYEKMFALKDAIEKNYPEFEDFVVMPIMFEYYFEHDDKEGLVRCFFELAQNLGRTEIGVEDLGSIVKAIAFTMLHPQAHPHLTSREEESLLNALEVMEEYFGQDEEEDRAGAEATRRLNDPDDTIIPIEEVMRNLGLENAV